MLRFRLRTLFVVVTLIAAALGWLAWQREIARQRAELLTEVVNGGGEYVTIETDGGTFVRPDMELKFKAAGPAALMYTKLPKEQRPNALGWWSPRSWFGDAKALRIDVPTRLPPDTIANLQRWFPEASVQGKADGQ